MTLVERSGRWGVKVWDDGRYRWIGTFPSRDEALMAEDRALESVVLRPVRPRLNEPRGPVVYFVMAPSLGFVKIGYSADINMRFADLSCASPVELQLTHTIPGTPALEREMHARFRLFRVRGEWFRVAGALEQLLTDAAEAHLTLVEEA